MRGTEEGLREGGETPFGEEISFKDSIQVKLVETGEYDRFAHFAQPKCSHVRGAGARFRARPL